jgi:hypothetical protein
MGEIVKLEITTDYRQFVLKDEESKNDFADLWDKESIANMMAVRPDVIGVRTRRVTSVPVTVEVLEEPLTLDNTVAWDHVNECTIQLPSGKLVVMGVTDYFPSAKRIVVAPGKYGVRIFYGNLDSVSYDAIDGEDFYRVELWLED